jgi:hypothetical protein
MGNVLRLDRIRSIIRHTFVELGGLEDQLPQETMLIRNGFFCGRRFDIDGLQAVWFTEEDEIKFFGRSGSLERVISLDPDSEERPCDHLRAA